MSVAVIYGSTTGYTEDLAMKISRQLDDLVEVVREVQYTSPDKMMDYETLIIGVPTWHHGQLQSDWADRYEELDDHDFSGIQVAFFGSGDADRYPEHFQDALGILWEKFEALGAELIGKWPTEGYAFEDSKALLDNGTNFVGLAFSKFDKPDVVDERIERWADQLRDEIF